MFTKDDIKQLSSRGISEQQVSKQLSQIKTGFPYLRLSSPASVGRGIMTPGDEEIKGYINEWNKYKAVGKDIMKFVPASGAASRMFRDLFAFLAASYDTPTTGFEKTFFTNINEFAFYGMLNDMCERNEHQGITELIAKGKYKAVVDNLINEKGLDYGNLPKGLLLFHRYADGIRTAMEEHLVEAALYASSGGMANVHFTVSHEHLPLFHEIVDEKVGEYERKYDIHYNISFSEQAQSTDTIAANMDDTPFRRDDNTLLFRPGGHGALIKNLSDTGADVVFIKNIDNIVPERLEGDTITYKQLIAGVLVAIQRTVFKYMEVIDSKLYTHNTLIEGLKFLENVLWCHKPDAENLDDEALASYLRVKFNRPIRVCGMVRNVGEPGGGPFLAYNKDGSISPQILESTQIDNGNPECVRMFKEGTHFNPVDIVCAIKDYRGVLFNLPDYVDPQTGFISVKSKGGRKLKALELPGLWNGAMSDWNTVFVQVPLSTFNPVKTVNDLLRDEHQ